MKLTLSGDNSLNNIKKFLLLAFVLLPGFALADSEAVVEPIKTDNIVTVAPSESDKIEIKQIVAVLPEVVPEPKKETPKPVAAPAPVIYEVQSGDTLTAIGDSYHTPWTRIYDANTSIADPNVITPGQKLRIPKADENVPSRSIPQDAPPVTEPAAQTSTPSAVAPVTHTTAELIGKYGYALAGGNCVNTAKAYGKNQPGNPISWAVSTQTPFIGAAALFAGMNHVGVVVGIHSNGDLEIAHENCPGCPSRYPRSAFRGFF